MKHIKFEKIEIQKSQFFSWLTQELEKNGWQNITSHFATEGWYYQSKGNDGKSNIIVNFRDGYDGHNNAYQFTTTSSRLFDIRMVISYEQSTVSGKAGVSVPALSNAQFTRLYVGTGVDLMYPDTLFKIYYNCNKNRMTFLIDTGVTTFMCMFGKPDRNYAKEYQDTGNMIFTMYNYRLGNVGSWGIADRPTTEFTAITPLFVPIENSFSNNKLTFSEIGFGSSLEGFKGYLEGVYYVGTKGNVKTNAPMTGDKFVDELGNEYILLYAMNTVSSSYPTPFANCHFAICTKLAGEE